MRKSFRWAAPIAAAAIAIGAVLAAPLASPNKASAGPIISGARTLSDQVSVNFAAAVPAGHDTTDVHLLAFNDLHGTLDPAGQTLYGQFAGGAAYLAKAIKDRQAQYGQYEATLCAGDNIGASPLASGLFHDEPIQVATNLMHADFCSVGNHEFDEGSTELLRMQNGGCHPTDGCQAAPYALANGGTTNTYPGADFHYLSANVIKDSTGQPLFPAYGIKQFTDGQRKFKVGFIGEVLQSTPTIVTPTGVAGLTFQDEANAANKAVADLADQGVKVPILVIHQGGFQSGAAVLNGCAGNLAGSDIAAIADRLDPAIKVIVSAHTHAEYRCTYTSNGVTRLITSASSFGRALSDITLTIDNNNDKLVSASASNILIRNALNTPGPGVVRQPDTSLADPTVQSVVTQYVNQSAPLANKVIGVIQGNLLRESLLVSPLGEWTLGDVIADGQYDATHPAGFGGAAVAFMNPGGIRADMRTTDISPGGEAVGEVTYGEAFTVQPFGNTLVTKTMTGDMIRRLLQQQFQGCGGTAPVNGRILQISSTMSYEMQPAPAIVGGLPAWPAPTTNVAATCAGRIGNIWINGALVQPTDVFRVTMNNFLATGGDGFTVFNEGTSPLGGAVDLDAFTAYFAKFGAAGIPVPPLNRIVPIP
jgi:5'-nucleotidase